MNIKSFKKALVNLIRNPLIHSRRLKLPEVCTEVVPHQGFLDPKIDLLIGTASGLYGVFSGQLRRLIKGRVYGISECEGRWYVAVNQKLAFLNKLNFIAGYIISFELIKNKCENLKVEFAPLGEGVHQIQWYRGDLLVADTPNNRLLVLAKKNGALSVRKEVFPRGRVTARTDTNYCHLNSIHPSASSIFLVYHNDSIKTGRNSEIAQLDEHFNVVGTYPTDAKCAHNFFDHSLGYIYCDSLNGQLIAANKPVFQVDSYLRGLTFIDRRNQLVVGGSGFQTKTRKVSHDGVIYYLDSQFNCSEMVRLMGIGSIYEIREVPPKEPH